LATYHVLIANSTQMQGEKNYTWYSLHTDQLPRLAFPGDRSWNNALYGVQSRLNDSILDQPTRRFECLSSSLVLSLGHLDNIWPNLWIDQPNSQVVSRIDQLPSWNQWQ